ncbi:MAG: hypothetical protein ACK40U_00280 [Fervidobacterium pennivorans]
MNLAENEKNTILKKLSILPVIAVTVIDLPALLFSYYVFAGIGNYPIVNILLGYLIDLVVLERRLRAKGLTSQYTCLWYCSQQT